MNGMIKADSITVIFEKVGELQKRIHTLEKWIEEAKREMAIYENILKVLTEDMQKN